MFRLYAALFAGLLLLAAPPAHAQDWSATRDWLARDSEVLCLTNGELAAIGGGVVVVGGVAFLVSPAAAGGVVGAFLVIDVAAKLALVAGAGGAMALGYDLEEDLGIPPFWEKVPRFWERAPGPGEVVVP